MTNAFLTACSAGKNSPPVSSMASMPQGVTPAQWLETVHSLETRCAIDMYRGESFSRLAAVSFKLSTPLWIVSAELGFVHSQDRICSYDASFSNEVAIRVQDRFSGSKADWLAGLTRERGDGQWWNKYCNVICAVPVAYEDAVAELVPNAIFITARKELEARKLLYDRRLNDPRCPYRGRDSDYKARQAEHFADLIYPQFDQSLIEADLSQYKTRHRDGTRVKITDEQVLDVLRTTKPNSVSAALNSFLANGIAMGKKRLQQLWDLYSRPD